MISPTVLRNANHPRTRARQFRGRYVTDSPSGIVAFTIALLLVIPINDYCRFLKEKRASCSSFFFLERRALRFRGRLADDYLALIRD